MKYIFTSLLACLLTLPVWAAGSVNIKTYLDGVPKHDCTISGSNAFGAGQFGLVTYGSGTNGRFDDFTVSVP